MEFQKVILDCGAPLFVYEIPSFSCVRGGILIKAGFRNVGKLAHVYEHVVFEGNRTFSSSQELSDYIEVVGGDLNAYTEQEAMLYYARVPSLEVGRLSALCTLFIDPLLDENDIHKEIGLIVKEESERVDEAEVYCSDMAEKLAYGDHPLGRGILPDIASLKSIRRDDLLEFQKRLCHPDNFAFFAVGGANTKEAFNVFNSWASFIFKGTGENFIREERRVSEPEKRFKVICREGLEHAYTTWMTTIGPADSKQVRALQLFSFMVDYGMSAPIFQSIRNLGLSYGGGVSTELRSDESIFWIATSTTPEETADTTRIILEVMEQNKNNEELFIKAKNIFKYRAENMYDGTFNILDKAVRDTVLYGEPKTIKESVKRIKDITLKEVIESVDQCLAPEKLVKVYVAPPGFEAKL